MVEPGELGPARPAGLSTALYRTYPCWLGQRGAQRGGRVTDRADPGEAEAQPGEGVDRLGSSAPWSCLNLGLDRFSPF